MSTHNLPAADQPDKYSGAYPGRRPDITRDTTDSSLLHLNIVAPRSAGTYCGAMPGAPMAFTRWFSIQTLLDLAKTPLSSDDQAVPDMWLCSSCCTLLAVEVEMTGQNKYRTKTLVDALRALEKKDTPRPHRKHGRRHA